MAVGVLGAIGAEGSELDDEIRNGSSGHDLSVDGNGLARRNTNLGPAVLETFGQLGLLSIFITSNQVLYAKKSKIQLA